MVARVTTPEFGVPDEDSPEWTEADFARAKPAREVLGKQVSEEEGIGKEPTRRDMKQPGLDGRHTDQRRRNSS
jgi:hypothetical protein